MQLWKAGLFSKRSLQDFRTETRTTHSQYHGMRKTSALGFFSQAGEQLDMGPLLVNDVQPAEPPRLAPIGPER